MLREYDFIVIGGGSAGFAAARTAREHTQKVAVIDRSEKLGGLCILRGCMPSKTLIYAAEVLHLASKGASFGLDIPKAAVDMKRLAARKKKVIAEFAEHRRQALESGKFDLYRGSARFVGRNDVELDDGARLRGRKILVATGSVVNRPHLPGLESIPLWTSDDALDLDFAPESVIVLGGGVVACELAQFLRRIGSRVTVIQRSAHILKDMAPDLAAVVEQAFRDEGIDLYTGTTLKRLAPAKDGIEAVFDFQGREVTVQARHCLNALGRRPDTEFLQPAEAGVLTSMTGHIVTNEYQRTTNPDIYAAGDCAGPHEIVHIAIQQAELAVRHALGQKVAPMHYDNLIKVVFTDPQAATAGLSAAELRRRGQEFLEASYPFNDHGKSILMEANYGFARILAEPGKGRILGAEIVGKDAGELIHALSVSITMRATVFDLLRAPWYHPTLAEILSYPIEEIAEKIAQLHCAHGNTFS